MQKSFADVGINADILVAKPLDFVTLEHESGTLWYHHFVIYATGLIYDPNYRRKSPLDISVYPSHAFPEQNVCLWKPGNKEPVLQYKYAA